MAWNVERGRRPDLWVAVPAIAAADVLLLTEVDRGMARRGNRHVARELAEQLGMACVSTGSCVDWILTRGIEAVAEPAALYETPRDWMRLSEHDGVGVRLRLG